jgi:putative peptide zinc metalloprotease protein
MPDAGRGHSGKATATRPRPDHLANGGSDGAEEAGRRGGPPDAKAGMDPALAAATASTSIGNGVSKAEVGAAVLYPALEIEQVDPHAGAGLATAAYVPHLAPGAELLGEYQGSGLADVTFLVRSPSGQVVHLSRLLYLVLSEIDGSRTLGEIAARVTVAFGRTVSAGNVEYLLVKKFAPLGLVVAGEGAGGVRAVRQDPAILTLKLRRTLIPAGGVQIVARLFGPLFSPLVVVVIAGLLVATDVWLFGSGRALPAFRYVLVHPLLVLAVLGLLVLSMLFHECGHAAACRYGGATPGVIGMGMYVIWPAFFTNVTDSYQLGRAGRIRVDLGGVYFNAVSVVVMAAAYLATGYVPLLAAIVLVQVEMIDQLLPSLRFDGYFILTDLVGVPDLFARMGPVLRSMIPGRPADPRVGGLRRGARLTLTAWVLVMVPLLTAELVLLIVAIPRLARALAHSLDAQAHDLVAQFGRADVAAGLVTVISVLLLVLPMAGICYVLLQTGLRFGKMAIAANRRHPALRVPSVVVAVLATAGLAAYWGLLPLPGRTPAPPRPAAASAPVHEPALAQDRPAWPFHWLPSPTQPQPHRHHHHHRKAVPILSQPPAYVPPPPAPSPSATAKPSESPSPKASKSPSRKASKSSSPTPSGSSTPSPTPSGSSTPSPTPSPSA